EGRPARSAFSVAPRPRRGRRPRHDRSAGPRRGDDPLPCGPRNDGAYVVVGLVSDGPASPGRAKTLGRAGDGARRPHAQRGRLAEAQIHRDDRPGVDAALSAGVRDRPRGDGRLRDRWLRGAARDDAADAAMGRAARSAFLRRAGKVPAAALGRGADPPAAEIRLLPVRWRAARVHRPAVRDDGDGADPGDDGAEVSLPPATRRDSHGNTDIYATAGAGDSWAD